MSHDKIGVIAAIVFLAFLGSVLFVYVAENRLLRKQIEMLSDSVEDAKTKCSYLDVEHSHCAARYKRASIQKDEVSVKVDDCIRKAAQLEKDKNNYIVDSTEMKTELISNTVLARDLRRDNAGLERKLNRSTKYNEEFEKAKEEAKANWKSKLEICRKSLKLALCGTDTPGTSKPTEEGMKEAS